MRQDEGTREQEDPSASRGYPAGHGGPDCGDGARKDPYLLEMRGICKRFPGVKALDGVDLKLKAGTVLGLLGVNGAGKSTLMNVLGGVLRPDAGEIRVDGRLMLAHNPRESSAAGIAFVHQELAVYPNLSLTDNVLLPELPSRLGIYRSRLARKKALEALEIVGLAHRQPGALLETLPPGEQQLVEIARALAKRVRILILDESTSSLASREVKRLFEIVRRIKRQGVGVIFLSHRMEEVQEICDEVAVLRDHRNVALLDARTAGRDGFVFHMLGRGIPAREAPAAPVHGTESSILPVLGVRRIAYKDKLTNVSFNLGRGEIVGIAGLLGSGRSELLRCIFGLERHAGHVLIDGVERAISGPGQAVALGIGLVTEDRRYDGLLIESSIRENVVLASLAANANRFRVMRASSEEEVARRACSKLNIRACGIGQVVGTLSGGNQQKVVIAKWLETAPRVLLLDEPTRGVDVGAKEEIYRLITELAEKGTSVIFVSSELGELVRVCHRILILRSGRIVEEFSGAGVTEHDLLRSAAAGGRLQ